MYKKKSILCYGILSASALIYILIFPYEAVYYTKNALSVCALSVIPSLFLFMVFTKILSHLCSLGFMSGKATRFISRILNIPVCLVPICLTSLVCGAPSGTISICSLYSEGYCTKSDAERACLFSGNCSAAFITGIVSASLGSRYAAVCIFFSNLAASLTIYFLLFRSNGKSAECKKRKSNSISVSQAVSESISSSAGAAITLSAFVVFFYTVGGIISSKAALALQSLGASYDFANTARVFICSLFEISLGVNSIQLLSGTTAVLMAAFSVSFTGISLIFQVTGIMKRFGLPVKNYVLSKMLCSLLCPVFLTLLLLISPMPLSVFSAFTENHTYGISVYDVIVLIFITAVVFAAAHLLAYLDKKHKK